MSYEEALEKLNAFLKTALGKFTLGEPDVITKRVLIYKTENLAPEFVDKFKKWGADGVEIHVTLPKKGNRRAHISCYVYKVVNGRKVGWCIARAYLDDTKSLEGFTKKLTGPRLGSVVKEALAHIRNGEGRDLGPA